MICTPTTSPSAPEAAPANQPRQQRQALDKPKGCKVMSEDRLSILARDGFTCQYCGLDMLADPGLLLQSTIDHVRPKSKGGGDQPDNLVACCFACNQFKGDYPSTSLEDGRAFITMKRAAYVGYFARAVEFYGVELPTRQGGIGGNFRTDIAGALGQFAHQAARIIDRMSRFKFDAERVLGRFEAIDLVDTVFGDNSTAAAELPAEDSPQDLAEITAAVVEMIGRETAEAAI